MLKNGGGSEVGVSSSSPLPDGGGGFVANGLGGGGRLLAGLGGGGRFAVAAAPTVAPVVPAAFTRSGGELWDWVSRWGFLYGGAG